MKGRPPKQKPVAARAEAGVGGGIFDRVAAMALEEAMRPITVREGDRIEQLPAMQAVLRAMFRNAAHNEVKTQRQILDLVNGAESARATAAAERLVFLTKLRERGLKSIAEHKRKGLPPPELYPSPYDIITDEATGETTIDGPTTKEEAGAAEAGSRTPSRGSGNIFLSWKSDSKQRSSQQGASEATARAPALQGLFRQARAAEPETPRNRAVPRRPRCAG